MGYYTDAAYDWGQPKLILCGARWYSPELGRWLSRDPIGYRGGPNLYEYCGGSPVGGVDPSGLDVTGVWLHGPLEVDTDGCPDADVQRFFNADGTKDKTRGDPWHQPATSLKWGTVSLNSKKVPYTIYINNKLGIGQGDLAIFYYTNGTAHASQAAIVGDYGHSMMGEGSVALHWGLGRDPGPKNKKSKQRCYQNGLPASPGVTVLVFPGSAKGFRDSYATPGGASPYTMHNIERRAAALERQYWQPLWEYFQSEGVDVPLPHD